MATTTTKTVHAVGPRKAVVWIARLLSYLIYFYLLAVEVILFLGFFLLLFGANPDAGFTDWVYRNLDRVMQPFRGIFSPIELGTTSGNVESVFETSVLFAMIVYGIVAIAFSALIGWLTHRLQYLEAAELEAQRAAEEAARQAEWEAERRAAAERAAVGASAATVVTTTTAVPPTSVPPGSVPPPPPPTG